MSTPSTNEANRAATEQPAGSAIGPPPGEAIEKPDCETAAAHAEFEKSRNRDAELHLEGEDDSGLHIRDHGFHISDDSLPLAGTDGNRPRGTIVKG